MVLAGVVLTLFLIFSLGFYINLWVGAFIGLWTIASLVYTISNLGNKYGNGTTTWYDQFEWIIGAPALVVVYIFAFFDRLVNNK